MNGYYRLLTGLFFLFLSTSLSAQTQDEILTGYWVGYYTYLGKNYPIEIDMEVKDGIISGTSLSTEEGANYKVRIEGKVDKNGKIKYKGKEELYKESSGCLSTNTFNLVPLGNGMYLMEGKWNCVVGGKVNVTRQVQSERVNKALERSDIYTTEFVKGMEKRDYHALFVCVENYSNDEIEDLSRPVTDGKLLKQALILNYKFKEQNITFLENPGRQQIIDELDRLSEELDDFDNLLIFFAGHGIWDEDLKQGYWLPADAKLSSKGQWLSNATIRDYVRSIQSKHTLLIADACFSGGILKERSASISGKAITKIYNLPSRKAVTSGTLTTVPDESVFSEYLVKNLNENQDQILPADMLFTRMKVAVINNSPNSQVPQYGAIHMAGDEGGDFIFIREEN